MKSAVIHQLIDVLIRAFGQLGAPAPMSEIEKLAVVVHRVMTVQARHYHSVEHVFGLVDPSSPIRSLAALFHDLVYYQVDSGIAPEVCAFIAPCIIEKQGEVWLVPEIAPDDRLFGLTLDLFGFSPGQRLTPQAGLNEFLSALFMNKRLGGLVREQDLARATVCVEATIPFRGVNPQGLGPFDILAQRLGALNQRLSLGMSEAEVERAVQEAVVFANQDVISFADADVGRYLDGTWKLLPETNIALRSGKVYSIRDYRRALQSTDRFLNILDPELIYHGYHGIPSEPERREMVEMARRNLAIGREYLGIKLVAIAIYEALAEITGGDAPLSLFMGDVRREGEELVRLEDMLPPVQTSYLVAPSEPLRQLLETGRASDSDFDTKNSPTSLFLYKSLGPEGVKLLSDKARQMFDGQVAPREFLSAIDPRVVAAIARAGASIVVTRRAELLRYISELAA
jgi:hypothetical protein